MAQAAAQTDRDQASIDEARRLAQRAKQAAPLLAELSQDQIDRIVGAMAAAARPRAESFAKLAVEETGFGVVHTLTRSQPPGWTGHARRIDEPMLAETLGPLGTDARAYVCGPTALVESVADTLVRLGLRAERVRTERFGPSGT